VTSLRLTLLGALLTSTLVAVPASAACSWPAAFEADTTNTAYPDSHASYWLARFTAVPGTHLRIDGQYPAARYFSFHAYDEAQRPVGSIADLQVVPDAGSQNPFVTPGAPHGGAYSVRVEPSAPPASPAPNTIYAGRTAEGAPNPAGMIIYRVYVSDDPEDRAGRVPLPDLTLETSDGAVSIPFERCEPLPPSVGGPITDTIADSSYPQGAPAPVPFTPAQNPPEFVKFWSLATNVIDRFPPNPLTDPLPRDKTGGFLSNQHINYLFALTARTHGELFVMKAKAPSAPDTFAGEDVTTPKDLRYFSICQNSFSTQRFTACVYDADLNVDTDGTFTLVISDPDDRPSNATNWLPWGGPYYDGNVIYRHMLPSAGFDGAIQRVPYGTHARNVMGAYYPESAYCDRATFESGGFAGCKA
jgi:hypothetical protein